VDLSSKVQMDVSVTEHVVMPRSDGKQLSWVEHDRDLELESV
jgi:hypothetical protein